MITSSSINIRRPGDNRRVRPDFRTAAPLVASMVGRLSITGGRSLPVCRGRASCRGSLGSSQSSRCVFDKVCSSRISISGKSGTSLFLSCEGIVTSSSSRGSPQTRRSHPRTPSNHQSPVASCFSLTEKIFLHSALPLVPPELNPGHGHQNVADSRREGNSRNNSWSQLNHLFNNRGSCLSHTTDTA